MINGIGVSPGISIGKILLLKEEELVIEQKQIEDMDAEKKKFYASIEKSTADIERIKEKALSELGQEKAQIFEAHLMMIQDPELSKSTEKKIEEGMNAEFAFKQVSDSMVAMFEAMDNEYFRERAADIKDISKRVLTYLLGKEVNDITSLSEEVVLVAEDLTPSDTASMDKKMVKGFLTNIGGRTSHTAIMARSLEIPAIVGLKDITEKVENGQLVAFNGETGELVLSPSQDIIKEYEDKKEAYENYKRDLKEMVGKESVTKDGKVVELAGNIGTPKDVKGLKANDAEGVGLYRTEFLYMDRENFPTEEEQYQAYKSVLEQMDSKPIVIRTLDIGGDKNVDYLKFDEEMNPFLGYRAIRLCLDKTEIFKTQLRALLRASVHGKLRIMFPMISSLEELLQAKEMLEQVKQELLDEKQSVAEDIQVGMMIEVPSAAIISDVLAKHVDFFSIGTNDLIQYTTAVDRMNEKISYLYNPCNPAVLRLIKMVIDNGHKENIWVGMCGELAGDQRIIPILLGMGLDEFSMSPISILPARKLIRSLSLEDAKKISDKVLSMGSAKEINEYLDTL